MKFRILPIFILIAFVSVVVKISDFVVEKAKNSDKPALSSSAIAAEAEKKKEEPKAAEDGKKHDEKDAKADESKKAEGADGAPSEGEKSAEGEKPAEGGEATKDSCKASNEVQITNMSDMEKNLLENLSTRRKELEDWSSSIEMKESILNATEQKINTKMDELKKLQEEVAALLAQYNSKEKDKIDRLVKIYENMKPKDAAAIFDKMDMDLLIEIVENMKEDNSAKILSKIDPEKAKEVTTRLAKKNRLSTVN